MKTLHGSHPGCNRQSFAFTQAFRKHLLLFALAGLLFASCKKQGTIEPVSEIPGSNAQLSDATVLSGYTGLSAQTMWELQQARAATAKYRHLENAKKDGYEDIAVVVEEMGHHFMRKPNVDGTFDLRNPEILVYAKDHDGNFELVAVEYAVPIELTPNVAPAGFSGNKDVWDKNTGFGLWLLHAWVWSFNPNGVFNPTNPLVHTH